MKIIVFLAHFSLHDGPCPPPMVNAPSQFYKFVFLNALGILSLFPHPTFLLDKLKPPVFPVILFDPKATMSDHLLMAVLSMLQKEVSEHGRNLVHYFSLFHTYASLGFEEKKQLLKVHLEIGITSF